MRRSVKSGTVINGFSYQTKEAENLLPFNILQSFLNVLTFKKG